MVDRTNDFTMIINSIMNIHNKPYIRSIHTKDGQYCAKYSQKCASNIKQLYKDSLRVCQSAKCMSIFYSNLLNIDEIQLIMVLLIAAKLNNIFAAKQVLHKRSHCNNQVSMGNILFYQPCGLLIVNRYP